jgi:DNA polymerase
VSRQARYDELAARAARCTSCPLYERATQTVFGDGSVDARLVLVGEQPGDKEDLAGEPFVGPAGRVLDEALDAAGVARDEVYVTNAVKHFKWQEKGKRRIHQKPNRSEVVACRQWLDAELELVEPDVLVTLGATAGQALLGSAFRIKDAEGAVLSFADRPLVATLHPSAVLRARERAERDAMFERLAGDLRRAAALPK